MIFTHDDVFRVLRLKHSMPARILTLAVLKERISFEPWMLDAIEEGWSPPDEWHRVDRRHIADLINDMVDKHLLIIDANWNLRATGAWTPVSTTRSVST